MDKVIPLEIYLYKTALELLQLKKIGLLHNPQRSQSL